MVYQSYISTVCVMIVLVEAPWEFTIVVSWSSPPMRCDVLGVSELVRNHCVYNVFCLSLPGRYGSSSIG